MSLDGLTQASEQMAKKKLKNYPTNEDLKKMFSRARYYLINHGYASYLADDFAQLYLLKVCEGRKVLLDKLFVDFLRSEFGDTRHHYGTIKSESRLRLNEASLDRLYSRDSSLERDWHMPKVEITAKEKWILQRLDEGYSQKEIGEHIGVTESRVSQILRRLKE
jgi:DNA-binding CsgD family transcriptional regulator